MRMEGKSPLTIDDFYEGQYIYFYYPETHVRDGSPEPLRLAIVTKVNEDYFNMIMIHNNSRGVARPSDVYALDSEMKK